MSNTGKMKKNEKRSKSNVPRCVKSREINERICGLVQKRLHVTDKLIDRLGLEAELRGHEGCVNCLEWSENGNYLASGSDDLNVILWDPFRKKLLCKYPTQHQNNIFSVKFLPKSNDTKIVTGSADYQVLALDAVVKETYYVCTCANARIKRIATAPDSPSVFWSAAEDGLIRQHDLRNLHTCDNGAQNVVINLRNHQGALAEAKCIAINPLRTEMMAVGSNDPYIRLYDRRMIKLTNDYQSSEWYRRMVEDHVPDGACTEADLEVPWDTTDNLVKGCVQYFVPGHLRAGNGINASKHTAITYLSFSPDGRELLANLGNEQIYLFDVTKKHAIRYFSVPNAVNIPRREINETVTHASSLYSCNVGHSPYSIVDHRQEILPESINKLRLEANEFFKDREFFHAIRLYNDAIAQYPGSPVLYGNRAAAYMRRGWKGDVYAAIRDCRMALQLDPDYMKVFFRLARCFYEMKLNKEAQDCLDQFKIRFSNHADNMHCRALEKDIELASKKRQNDSVKRNSRSGTRTDASVILSLHLNGIYVADTNVESRISNPEKLWRDNASDFEQRYCGHCNATTDIKEATFFGRDGRYIVAGSDDGSIYFWNRYSENNIRVLRGDSSIVNCLQPHPTSCLLASSGIDPVVRLWSPMPEEGWENDYIVEDLYRAAEKNHDRMKRGLVDVVLSHSGTSSDDSSYLEEPSYPCRPS